jgi:hypothetical protein
MPIKDLIEDWIQIRSTLQKQLQTIQRNENAKETGLGSTAEATVSHLKKCLDELNLLLKEHASD